MTTPTYRFFLVKEGPVLERAKTLLPKAQAAAQQHEALCKVVGASESLMDKRDGAFAGFVFEVEPNKNQWKQARSGAWWPKRNTKGGRGIHDKIKGLPPIVRLGEALRAANLYPGSPAIIWGMTGYCSTIAGSPEQGIIVIRVPWLNLSEETLALYRSGGNFDGNYQFVSTWTPCEGMVEVQEWEALKVLDDLREVTNAQK